jgi:tetratricopeptide (TPR) repeat protein
MIPRAQSLPLVLALAAALASPVGAQQPAQERGARPAARTGPSGTRHAVVVGISRYLYLPPTKQLEYAAADAQAFAQVLRSRAGGSVPAENIRLLVNDTATLGRITEALNWLAQVSQRGDEAVIYFAGHGDVETLTVDSGGFLLATDVPNANNYFAGGAVEVGVLDRFVRTIVAKGASVLVITDACRAGKLVGDAGGAERTTAALLRSWSGVAKLVSSAPDQSSYEGKQWGGGHGAFTYFLIAGLEGLADADSNSVVTLRELQEFVRNRVERETGGQQTPQETGDDRITVSWVDTAAMFAAKASLESRKATQVVAVRAVDSVPTDTILTRAVESFRSALTAGALLEPRDGNAWDAYQRLSRMSSARPVLDNVRSALAAALQDEAQKVILDYLAGGNAQPGPVRLGRAADLLGKASELLGRDYVLASAIEARRLFLQGYAQVRGDHPAEAIPILKRSITLEPRAAYAYNALGFAYLSLDQLADARTAFTDAQARAPRWSYPAHGLGLIDAREGRQADAQQRFEQAIQEDPTYMEPRRELASLYVASQRPADAERVLLEALALDSSNASTLADLGSLYQSQQRYAEAARTFERLTARDSLTAVNHIRLGIAYYYQDRLDDAVQAVDRAIRLDGQSTWAYRVLGYLRRDQKRYDEAEQAFRRAVAIDPYSAQLVSDLAVLLKQQNRMVEAEQAYRRATALDSLNPGTFEALGSFYYNLSRFTEAEGAYRAAVTLAPDSARLVGFLAWTHRKLGQTGVSIPEFARAAALDSLNDDRHNDLGVALFELQRFEEALTAFQRAATLKPGSALYAANIALSDKRLRRWDDAERATRRAVQLDSLNAERYADLGLFYRERERFAEAAAAYRRASQLDPASPAVAAALGVVHEQLGDSTGAEREYQRAVRLDSTNSDRYNDLGVFYFKAQRFADARAAFAHAGVLAPRSAIIARNVGLCEERLGRAAAAEREYRRALALDSSYIDAQSSLAFLAFGQGKLAEAEALWRAGLRLKPNDPNALNNVAWVLYGRGELAQAATLSDRSLADTSLSPADRRTYLDTRANIALDAGAAANALALFERALTDNPKPDPGLYFGRAMTLLELGREAEAVAAYRQAVAAEPRLAQPAYLTKTVYYSARALTRLARLQALAH